MADCVYGPVISRKRETTSPDWKLTRDRRSVAVVVFSIVGILFSAYLTYYTFTSGQSACELQYFGLPSCFYGLVVYALIFIPGVSLMVANRNKNTIALVALSVLGIGFSGYLTAYIISLGPSCVVLQVFGAPPCVLGLIMYALIFVIGLSLLTRKAQPPTS